MLRDSALVPVLVSRLLLHPSDLYRSENCPPQDRRVFPKALDLLKTSGTRGQDEPNGISVSTVFLVHLHAILPSSPISAPKKSPDMLLRGTKKIKGHIAARRMALASSVALWYHVAPLSVKDVLGAGRSAPKAGGLVVCISTLLASPFQGSNGPQKHPQNPKVTRELQLTNPSSHHTARCWSSGLSAEQVMGTQELAELRFCPWTSTAVKVQRSGLSHL